MARRARGTGIDAADVPQAATKLGRVRAVLAAMSRGASSTEAIAARARIARRHALYQIAAARALGWAERRGARAHAITDTGRAVLATAPGSSAERELVVRAVRASALVNALAGDLDPASKELEPAIAARIQLLTRPALAPETARERARTIAAWVRLAASRQRALPLA